jgi:hypothetical protein
VPATDAQDRTLENAPLGTRAPAIGGGHWIKVERGWKWHAGSTFPRPGGDWTGELIAPVAVDAAPELPPLPSPDINIEAGPWVAITNHRYYTADQMRTYGQACRAVGAGSREPLTDAQVAEEWRKRASAPAWPVDAFFQGVRFAESVYGIAARGKA